MIYLGESVLVSTLLLNACISDRHADVSTKILQKSLNQVAYNGFT